MSGGLVVTGDFNARSCEWGMPRPDTRGRLVVEMASRLGLVVLNTGSTPTYQRPGFGNSIPDVTLVSENLVQRAADWKVIGDFTGSDHCYITFQLNDERRMRTSVARHPSGYNTSRLDEDRLYATLQRGVEAVPQTPRDPSDREGAEAIVRSTMDLIRRACDESMPKRRPFSGRRQAYWWNDQIATLRREALRLRRRAQRARSRPEAAELSEDYKAAKKALTLAIKQSKAKCWRELCDDLNRDPFGDGYKLVTGRLGGLSSSANLDAATMRHIVDALFPTHPVRSHELDPAVGDDVPMFTAAELAVAAGAMKPRKAPGPDGIPSEFLRVVAKRCPNLLLRMYNACLYTGIFPAQWKVARLALISKGKGEPGSPSSYRPLCLLNTTGLLMERLVKPRLHCAILAAGGLSDHQYGFRKRRSTVDAISRVTGAVRAADTACHAARPVVLLVTLDVRNAFNTARWTDMLEALKTTFRLPGYLLPVMADYLRDRRLLYMTSDGPRERPVTASAAQGSVLGPDLWNVMYDGLLRMGMPEDSFLVGYADDVAVVITARTTELAQLKLNQVMRRVGRWMGEHGLQLAIPKTEIVMLTRRRIPTIVPMTVGTETIQTQGSAKYLGVVLDNKLSFAEHIRAVSAKAASLAAALSRLMANVGGPKPSKRKVLLSVTQSVLLYGAELWADALRLRKYRCCMSSVQRQLALRVACSYRTVSECAVQVVAGVIPIDLLALERKYIFERSSETGRTEAVSHARAQSMRAWQQRWSAAQPGRWTARLIGDLTTWISRAHGEVSFYLTQFLTGHGYFRAYLWRMGKVGSPNCPYCDVARDDAFHTFYVCDRFASERLALSALVGDITPDNTVGVMLRGPSEWGAVAAYVERVLRRKRDEGCLEDLPGTL